MGVRNISRRILTTKMRQIRVLRKTRAKQLNKARAKKNDCKSHLNNLIQEANLPTTPLGESINRNKVTGTEKPAHLSLLNKIGGSVKLLVGIVNPFRTRIAIQTDPTIQPTIVHSKKATIPGHSIGSNYPSVVCIVVLVFPDPGGILITTLV